ncbi:MAG: flagellar protein FliS [Clostridium sp.]|jgi:flagellar protein FliS|nr:flagellar protein FliS [Clostridium sp.]
MTQECKKEFTLRIAQANPTGLVVILYEMALCYLQEGKEARSLGDGAAFREANRKTRGCLNELLSSLHLEYEVAANLCRLYRYCLQRLAYSEALGDKAALEEVERILRRLQEAYAQVAAQDKSAPVMRNTQAVYAGLTYGKNTLTENMADQGANRGIRI